MVLFCVPQMPVLSSEISRILDIILSELGGFIHKEVAFAFSRLTSRTCWFLQHCSQPKKCNLLDFFSLSAFLFLLETLKLFSRAVEQPWLFKRWKVGWGRAPDWFGKNQLVQRLFSSWSGAWGTNVHNWWGVKIAWFYARAHARQGLQLRSRLN